MKEKAFERKAELLNAALDEFSAKGYEDASLNLILKQAGISKGTFYYHFADKQALYLFLLGVASNEKWNFIKKNMNQYAQTTLDAGNIFDRFRLQARLGAEFAVRYPRYHQLSHMFSKERGTALYETAKEYLGRDNRDLLSEMIDTAMAAGDFKPCFSKEFLLRILGYAFGGFDEIFGTEEGADLERMLNNLDLYVEFLRHGIGA